MLSNGGLGKTALPLSIRRHHLQNIPLFDRLFTSLPKNGGLGETALPLSIRRRHLQNIALFDILCPIKVFQASLCASVAQF